MTLRELAIDADVEVNASELRTANEEADRLIRTMRELERTYKVDIDMDGVEKAKYEIGNLESQINQIDGREIDLSVDANDLFSVQMDLGILQEQVNHLDGQKIDINVDVDTATAHAQLAALNTHSAVSGKNRTINTQPTGSIGNPLSGIGGIFSLGGLIKTAAIVTTISLLLPPLAASLQLLVGILGTLGVAIGVVAGGLFSFVSAIGVAAVGLGGFAALGITTIMELYDEKAKLTKQQKELKKETDSVAKSWNNLKSSLQGLTYGAIESGVKGVNTLLDRAEPILKNATIAADGLFDSLNKSIKGDNMTNFFSYMERAVGPLSANIGKGLGYTLEGIFNWMVALEPLTAWVGQGFENMMKRFSDWTASLQGSDRMVAFMDYVQDNLPKVGDIIGGMTDGIIGFFEGFDKTAADGLDWMATKMSDFAKWSSELDENEGFQDMLRSIREDGPVVASVISNISSGVSSMVGALSDAGVLKLFDKITDPDNFNFEGMADNLSLKTIFKPTWLNVLDGFEWSNVFDNLNPFKDINVSEIFSNLTPIDWARFIPGLNWAVIIGEFLWDRFIPKLSWPQIEGVSWSEFINDFIWPKIQDFSWSNFVSKFNWPTLPIFSWGNFISKLVWPSIPKFSWSNFVSKFSIGGGGKKEKEKDGSHANGLGRVPFNSYMAELHEDEAVLQAPQAQVLRDMGVLQGDGENPTLNPAPMVATTSNTTTNNQSAPVQVSFGDIIVQGGNTNEETGNAVRDKLEQLFGSMSDVIPLTLEV